eukprot:gene15768-17359_t
MAASLGEKLQAIDSIDIDSSGRFKYVLIKVTDGSNSKFIARGYDWAEFHADIFEQVAPGLEALGLKPKCCGGGRIQHDAQKKKITVYGYSMAYGPADHKITVELLKEIYPNYNEITFSNEGY